MSNIKPIETISAQELLEMPLTQVSWLVEGIIATGLTLLAGSPKVGKSWFSLLLALCVSEGKTFLDHATEKGEVLYLCLEDTFPRIQQRLFHLTDEASNRLHFAVMANKIKDGLVAQLEQQLNLHPELRLVIIDTLQTVRNPITNSDAYAADYGDLGILKAFADEHNLCVVLVHHTRKMRDETNIFNMVLGGNGLMGTADTTLVLSKENFFDDFATLSVTGRDVDLAEFKVEFVDCRWTLIEQTTKEELEEREIPSSVLMVVDFMASRAGNWEGTATRLINEALIEDIRPQVLTKYLNEHSSFLAKHGLSYRFRRTQNARLVTLEKVSIPSNETE